MARYRSSRQRTPLVVAPWVFVLMMTLLAIFIAEVAWIFVKLWVLP
jgi:hypothetical protein